MNYQINQKKDEDISKVYVVHFENLYTNYYQKTVELEDIENLFSPFGPISKILIFDRFQ